MRGKVPFIFPVVGVVRITPAYAGKRSDQRYNWTLQEDHPRLCGEKYAGVQSRTFRQGSPPPMRGKGSLCGIALGYFRITPAYAGKSRRSLCGIALG